MTKKTLMADIFICAYHVAATELGDDLPPPMFTSLILSVDDNAIFDLDMPDTLIVYFSDGSNVVISSPPEIMH